MTGTPLKHLVFIPWKVADACEVHEMRTRYGGKKRVLDNDDPHQDPVRTRTRTRRTTSTRLLCCWASVWSAPPPLASASSRTLVVTSTTSSPPSPPLLPQAALTHLLLFPVARHLQAPSLYFSPHPLFACERGVSPANSSRAREVCAQYCPVVRSRRRRAPDPPTCLPPAFARPFRQARRGRCARRAGVSGGASALRARSKATLT